ncbi:hypothetical protein PoB_003806200 [Plakobranchus ocellatus]|uniref:Uncharacterized protein n=1 Tax=Plakobranchus ocellatus TaxID=259542 RepID=A0AAV4AWA1_9GAST|nr:hypothetical protein PoB_003806200 [Plakobranchus ocellatus]
MLRYSRILNQRRILGVYTSMARKRLKKTSYFSHILLSEIISCFDVPLLQSEPVCVMTFDTGEIHSFPFILSLLLKLWSPPEAEDVWKFSACGDPRYFC